MAIADVGSGLVVAALVAFIAYRLTDAGTQAMGFAEVLIVPACAVGIAFAYFQFLIIRKTQVEDASMAGQDSLESKLETPQSRVPGIYKKIMEGAITFLRQAYTICGVFCVFFAGVIYSLILSSDQPTQAAPTAVSFLTGAVTSMLCGFLGMMIATFSNARTTLAAAGSDEGSSYTKAFNTAFRGGGVMGYALCSIGVIVLWVLLTVLRQLYPDQSPAGFSVIMDCVAGYGLGGSTVAMFGRVGGGIFTKAADVGADLVGKVVAGLEEDDPNNPATIADNVGDNVGDIAGMGADLFGSFAESTCAALVIGAAQVHNRSETSLSDAGWDALLFPVAISASGILVCMLCSFVATNIKPVRKQEDIEMVLKVQMVLTAVLMLPVIYLLAIYMLPASFSLEGVAVARNPEGVLGPKVVTGSPFKAFVCASMGTLGGLLIGLVTEYFTSHTYEPVKELATACKSGAAVNIIFGLALGYKSCIVPVFMLASAIYVSFTLCDLYGIALAALGMLSTLATGLTIDGFGPISDNAGGIAEMAMFPSLVRDRTDALDAAGNTTAAIGKGFAIGSAALVSLALYGAFVIRLRISIGVNILEPVTFAFLLVGAMIPYWFAALTMKSVGKAADEMVQEVKKQFEQTDSEGLTLLTGSKSLTPDYDSCIRISTKSSLWEMIAPGALVIGSPLVAGTLFGTSAVCGILTGSLVSSVNLAISMSNSGGAWDNCKKYIKNGFSDDPDLRYVKGGDIPVTDKARDAHDAAVQGDTVGDPFKDTSGPALNIVMKLQAIVSLVFASYFASINDGRGMLNVH